MPGQELQQVGNTISPNKKIATEMKEIMEDNNSAYPMLIIYRGDNITMVMSSHSDIETIKALMLVESGTTVVEE